MAFKHRGYEIEVDSNGCFFVTVGEAQVSELSLANCKKRLDLEIGNLDKPTIALPVYGVIWQQAKTYGGDPKRIGLGAAKVTGFNRTTREPQFSGLEKGQEMRNLVPDTEHNRSIIMKWHETVLAQEQAEKEMDKVLINFHLGYGRIDIDDYAAALVKARMQYDNAMEASK